MSWFDTHAHLAEAPFDEDRQAVLSRAWEAGLGGIVAVASDAAGARRALALAESSPPGRVWATVGLHPHEASRFREDRQELEELARDGRFVAVGEIGLDRHYDFASPEDQREALEFQLDLARRLELPVILHVREAEREMIEVLRAAELPAGGVWHCFTGSPGAAEEALAAGLHLGFGGLATFPSARSVREAAVLAPLDRIVLETDSPYLAPVPHRGRRNEPAHVAVVGRFLAGARGMPEDDFARATTANARRLFRLPPESADG